MIAGWVTDEYFLLNTSPDRHLSPLLPELLPELLKGMSKEVKRQFIDPSVEIYLALYEAIIRQVPDWEPELRLELAASLIKLPSKDAGIPQVNASLKVWLSYRGIDWHPSTPVIPLLAEVAKPEDESYFNTLYQVWELLGITDRVDMGNAYYRRGEDFLKRRDYEAACRDFERAITLGYVKAAERREIALHLQAHIREEALKPQVAEGQKKNDDFSNGSVIAAAVLAIGIMALENWSLEQAKQQAAKVQLKSAVGMDYRKLRDLLAVGKWQEADEETKRVMSEVLKRGEVNVVENIIDPTFRR